MGNTNTEDDPLYILFTDDVFEDTKFDFKWSEITKFIKLWNENWPLAEIAEEFKITEDNAGLIVFDLANTNKIKRRRRGFRGI